MSEREQAVQVEVLFLDAMPPVALAPTAVAVIAFAPALGELTLVTAGRAAVIQACSLDESQDHLSDIELLEGTMSELAALAKELGPEKFLTRISEFSLALRARPRERFSTPDYPRTLHLLARQIGPDVVSQSVAFDRSELR